MNNRFGLDARYFKEKLEQLARNAENYAPDEMARALERLRATAQFQQVRRFGTTGASTGEEG